MFVSVKIMDNSEEEVRILVDQVIIIRLSQLYKKLPKSHSIRWLSSDLREKSLLSGRNSCCGGGNS